MTILLYKKNSDASFTAYNDDGKKLGFTVSDYFTYRDYLFWKNAGGDDTIYSYEYPAITITSPSGYNINLAGFKINLDYIIVDGAIIEDITSFKQEIILNYKSIILNSLLPITDRDSKDGNNSVRRDISYKTKKYTQKLRTLYNSGVSDAFAPKTTKEDIIATSVDLTPSVVSQVLAPLNFLELFTKAEFIGFFNYARNATNTYSLDVFDLLAQLFMSTEVNLSEPQLEEGLSFLVAIGLLDSGRVAEILTVVKKRTIVTED